MPRAANDKTQSPGIGEAQSLVIAGKEALDGVVALQGVDLGRQNLVFQNSLFCTFLMKIHVFGSVRKEPGFRRAMPEPCHQG